MPACKVTNAWYICDDISVSFLSHIQWEFTQPYPGFPIGNNNDLVVSWLVAGGIGDDCCFARAEDSPSILCGRRRLSRLSFSPYLSRLISSDLRGVSSSDHHIDQALACLWYPDLIDACQAPFSYFKIITDMGSCHFTKVFFSPCISIRAPGISIFVMPPCASWFYMLIHKSQIRLTIFQKGHGSCQAGCCQEQAESGGYTCTQNRSGHRWYHAASQISARYDLSTRDSPVSKEQRATDGEGSICGQSFSFLISEWPFSFWIRSGMKRSLNQNFGFSSFRYASPIAEFENQLLKNYCRVPFH